MHTQSIVDDYRLPTCDELGLKKMSLREALLSMPIDSFLEENSLRPLLDWINFGVTIKKLTPMDWLSVFENRKDDMDSKKYYVQFCFGYQFIVNSLGVVLKCDKKLKGNKIALPGILN